MQTMTNSHKSSLGKKQEALELANQKVEKYQPLENCMFFVDPKSDQHGKTIFRMLYDPIQQKVEISQVNLPLETTEYLFVDCKAA